MKIMLQEGRKKGIEVELELQTGYTAYSEHIRVWTWSILDVKSFRPMESLLDKKLIMMTFQFGASVSSCHRCDRW